MGTIKKWTLYSLMGATVLCASCVDNDKDFSDPDSSQQTTLDLDIPSDFSWSTSRSVNLAVTAPVTSVVSIYTEADCSDKSLVADLPVGPENVVEGNVDVPASNEYLYVKYPTGETTTAISKVKIQNQTPAIRSANTSERGRLDVGIDELLGLWNTTVSDENLMKKYVTSGGIIFEDGWPDLADYDMNDLVADYTITSYVSTGDKKQYSNEHVEVSVTIRAIGGSMPDKLGLRFLGDQSGSLLQRHIGKYSGLNKNVNGLTVRLANPDQPDSAPIFYIEGLKQLKKGADFYNTKEQDDKNLTTITFGIYANELEGSPESSIGFEYASNAINQDFFLVTNNNREIHLRGYEATPLYSSYEADAAKSKDAVMSSDKAYSTTKNFVWAMKVIQGFHFPLEKVDIRQAYAPRFAQWVESNGGFEFANWHKYYFENPGLSASW